VLKISVFTANLMSVLQQNWCKSLAFYIKFSVDYLKLCFIRLTLFSKENYVDFWQSFKQRHHVSNKTIYIFFCKRTRESNFAQIRREFFTLSGKKYKNDEHIITVVINISFQCLVGMEYERLQSRSKILAIG
jgi:hypothetical protein